MGEMPVGGDWSSDAEQRSDLVPRRQDHERGEECEHEQRHPEADVGAPRCAPPLDPRAPPGPLAAVGALDRERVERRGVVVEESGSRAVSGIRPILMGSGALKGIVGPDALVNLRRGDGPPLVIGHRGAAASRPRTPWRPCRRPSTQARTWSSSTSAPICASPIRSRRFRRPPCRSTPRSSSSARTRWESSSTSSRPGTRPTSIAALRRHGLEERGLVSTAFSVTSRAAGRTRTGLPRAIGYPRDRYGIARVQLAGGLTRLGAAALRQVMPVRAPLLIRVARADLSRCTIRSARGPSFGLRTHSAPRCWPGRRTIRRPSGGWTPWASTRSSRTTREWRSARWLHCARSETPARRRILRDRAGGRGGFSRAL